MRIWKITSVDSLTHESRAIVNTEWKMFSNSTSLVMCPSDIMCRKVERKSDRHNDVVVICHRRKRRPSAVSAFAEMPTSCCRSSLSFVLPSAMLTVFIIQKYHILPHIMRIFLAQIFEGKISMHIIHGWYLKYLVSVLVCCDYLLHKISCTIICSKISAKIIL